MEQSNEIGSLAKALAAAQAELKDAPKSSVNPHFKSKYADLSAVRAAVVPVLSKHGLAVVQTNEPMGLDGVCVVTTLLHESGQWLRGKLFMPVQKKDAQGFGSALTYARRYSLAEIAGIASDDDDDGNAAVGDKAGAATKVVTPAASDKAASDEAEKLLETLFASAKTHDDLKAAQQKAADAVKAKALSAAAANRLREKSAEASARLNGAAA